jgi:alpha-D-ribose 1-methylphosphonate 5-triphosphate synthase subunit PhnH
MNAVIAGFATPVLSAQKTFRSALNALARPGTIHPLTAELSAPAPLSSSAAALALTLCDYDTPLWLDAGLRSANAVVDWLRFHCGSPIIEDPGAAAFAIVSTPSELPPLDHFNPGLPDYPDRSATLVLQLESLRSGPQLLLEGPGIRGSQLFRASPLPRNIGAQLMANHALFPRGVDLILLAEREVAALPRSVHIVGKDS